MEIVLSEKVQIWKKYNALVNFDLHQRQNYFLNNYDLMNFRVAKFNPTKIKILGIIFDVIPATGLLKTVSRVDNAFRCFYVQINVKTQEYFIGLINRRKWGEAKHFTTPEVRMEGKHPQYKGNFVKLFFAPCDTDRELEVTKQALLTAELLADPKCLNSRKGIEQIMTSDKYWKTCQVKGELSELDILGEFFNTEAATPVGNKETTPFMITPQPKKTAPKAKKTAKDEKTATKQAPAKSAVKEVPAQEEHGHSAKAINMVDAVTGDLIKTFASQKEAATWLVQEGKSKSISCASSISAVCRGVGNRKQAYGYKWEFATK